MEPNILEYRNILPGYLENSVLRPRQFYDTGIGENLEDIILNKVEDKEEEGSERGENMIERLFSDKGKTLKANIKALFNEIHLRQRLDTELLNMVDSDICRNNSYLEQLKGILQRQYTPYLSIAFSKRLTQLENQTLELEKEKRQEYLTCWKDLMLLKRYLLSALKDYWNVVNRRKFLEHIENGYRESLPENEAYTWQ